MIVSTNKQAEINQFEDLLATAKTMLEEDAIKRSDYYLSRQGVKFEKNVCDALSVASKGTSFQGTIKLISGRCFPDIVAKKHFGVEVKTSTKGSPWKCVGNSVLESSRVENVERIYLFFGKIIAPPEFKFRKYQDCLYDIAVTHSPRYMVDFEVPEGETIFDKMDLPYDQLRELDSPIKPFLSYYRKKHGNNCDVWWLDNEDDQIASSFVFKFWSKLNESKKTDLRCQMLALFPKIMRCGRAGDDKYNHAAAWLLKTHNVICHNFRDIFTGRSLANLVIGDTTYKNIPPFFKRCLLGNINQILTCLSNISNDEIEYYWKKECTGTQRKQLWLDQLISYGNDWLSASNSDLNMETFINSELCDETQ